MKKIVIVLSFFCCCNSSVELHRTAPNDVVILESDTTISLPIDSKTRINTNSIHYFQDSDSVEYITIENEEYDPAFGMIHCYRLDSCKIDHSVRLNYDGPNPVAPPIYGHTMLNKDELLVSVDVQKIIYKVNSRGEILHSYAFYDDSSYEKDNLYYPCNLLSKDYNPAVCIGSSLYLGLDLPPEILYPSEDFKVDFSTYPLMVKVDTATGNLERCRLHFPQLYDETDGVGQLNWYSHTYDGKNFVFSFAGLDSIYVSSDLVSLKAYPAKSAYIGDIVNTGYSRRIDGLERTQRYFSRPCYGNVVFDKFRGYYYRFCYFKDESLLKSKISELSRTNFMMCRGEYTIQIIDSDFNVVGETKFPRGKYVPMYFFVNKSGLWMSENNYERTDMSDDWLVFRCFNIVKNEK